MYDESNRGDTMNKILIVEDEQAICRLIKINLSDAGYSCKCAYDGKGAIELIEYNQFDLILLDIMLPEINGYELMEYIRPLEIPVIFLTAKGDVKDRVKGLKLGAEDYIVKPFEIIELVARVETVLRRYHKTSTVLSVYDISVDTLSRVVKKNDQVINLTVKEYDLLLLFIQNKILLFSVIEFMKRYGVIIIWEIAELLIFMYSECEKSLDWKIKSYQFTKLVIVWREIDEFFLEAVF